MPRLRHDVRGGFSPRAESVAAYANPAAEWVIVVFMSWRARASPSCTGPSAGSRASLLRDQEFLTYVRVILLLLTLGAAAPPRRGRSHRGHPPDRRVPGVEPPCPRPGSRAGLQRAGATPEDPAPGRDGGGRVRRVGLRGAKVVRYLPGAKWLGREITAGAPPAGGDPHPLRERRIPNEVMRAVTSLVFLYPRRVRRLGSDGRAPGGGRGPGDRLLRRAGLHGEHRARVRAGRPHGELRVPVRRHQGAPLPRHVDRAAGDPDRDRAPPPPRLAAPLWRGRGSRREEVRGRPDGGHPDGPDGGRGPTGRRGGREGPAGAGRPGARARSPARVSARRRASALRVR